MQVLILPLKTAADNIVFLKHTNPNFISIRDSSPNIDSKQKYDLIDRANFQNIFIVYFDDIENINEISKNEIMPSESNIAPLINWIQSKIKENNNDFVVQCTGGVSRSAAVAVLVEYIKNQNINKATDIINPILHSPNYKVLEIGEKILNAPELKSKVEKKINNYDAQNPIDINKIF